MTIVNKELPLPDFLKMAVEAGNAITMDVASYIA